MTNTAPATKNILAAPKSHTHEIEASAAPINETGEREAKLVEAVKALNVKAFEVKLREKVNKNAGCKEVTSGHCRSGQIVRDVAL